MRANHPTRRPRAATRAAIPLLLAACFGVGWLTAPPDQRAAASPEPAAAARAEAAAPAPAPPAKAGPNHLPEGFVPGTYDQELLSIDDARFAEFVRTGLRDEVLETCRGRLPKASDATCQKIYEATARVSPKFVDTRRRLLRGEIDSATFQALWHQHFLERQIALEQSLSWDDQLALDGVPPGNDMFLALSRWGIDQPEGSKLGLDSPQQLAETMRPEAK